MIVGEKKKKGEKSRARDFAIRLDHHSLKNDFPEHSFAPGQDTTDKDGKLKDYVNRKRLIYRSKQRGWLEVDLLLGSFATQFIPTMSQEELDDYELILNQETLDIFNFIIERDPLPEELKTPVMQQLQDFAATEKSRARDFAIRLDHHSLKNDFPEHSFAPGQDTTDKDGKLKDYVNRKRLIYRSKQRGWLEVDLLI